MEEKEWQNLSPEEFQFRGKVKKFDRILTRIQRVLIVFFLAVMCVVLAKLDFRLWKKDNPGLPGWRYFLRL